MRVFLVVSVLLLGGVVALHSKDLVDGSARTAPRVGPTLTELCKLHPTDKCAFHHNYVVMYEMLFSPVRNQKLRFLEIGVLEGHSLRLWEAYFPSAQIYGLDIKSRSQHDSDRIKTFIADQGNPAALAKVVVETGGRFDIILDDGGHTMAQQQVSFGVLFPALNSGGLYIIEDIHTSFPQLYPGYGVERSGANSTYALIDRFVRTQAIQSKYLTAAQNNYLSQNISHCMYFWRSSRLHSDFFACWKK